MSVAQRTAPAPGQAGNGRRDEHFRGALEQKRTTSRVAEALNARPSGDGWIACCPAHDDRNPSLSISEGDDGRPLMHCFAGCPQDAVIEALRQRGAWPEREPADGDATEPPAAHPTLGKPLARWTYTDTAGNAVLAIYRFDTNGSKTIRQATPTADGWQWKGLPKATARPLYRLHEIPGDDTAVLIVEGEKARDAAEQSIPDVFVTCWPGGTNHAGNIDLTPLHGRDVILWPDADAPGRKAMDTIATNLTSIASSVRLVDVSGLPEAADAADVDEKTAARMVGAAEAVISDAPVSIWDQPLDTRDLLSKPPAPIPWFARERIQLGRGILLTGIGGSSKTRTMYQLAIGAVVGRVPWDWEIESTGRALLVLTEDTAADVHRTLYWTCQALDLTPDERTAIGERIITYPLAGEDVRLLVGIDGSLTRSPLFYSLEERIKAYGDVVFVGLDPALSLTEGEEMEQSDQRQLGKMADDLAVRTGAATLLVSHATKASNNADELGSHNSRGGGAITDAVRAEFAMRTMTAKEASKAGIEDIEERKRHKQLVATKGNHVPPAAFAPVWLRAGDHGVLSEVAVDMDAGQGEQLTEREMRALEILESLSQAAPPRLADWRQHCTDEGVITGRTDEAIRKAMNRILARLRKQGLVQKGMGRGIWLPEAQA